MCVCVCGPMQVIYVNKLFHFVYAPLHIVISTRDGINIQNANACMDATQANNKLSKQERERGKK